MKLLYTEAQCLEITEQCPRFDSCSVNVCPLDLNQEHRTKLAGEPKCKLPKRRRMQIGAGTDLPYQGMTGREWTGAQKWARLSEAEKSEKRKRLVKVGTAHRFPQKRHKTP